MNKQKKIALKILLTLTYRFRDICRTREERYGKYVVFRITLMASIYISKVYTLRIKTYS